MTPDQIWTRLSELKNNVASAQLDNLQAAAEYITVATGRHTPDELQKARTKLDQTAMAHTKAKQELQQFRTQN